MTCKHCGQSEKACAANGCGQRRPIGIPAATRKLKAKPEALAARGCKLDTDADGNCPLHPNGCPVDVKATHGAGDVARENAERIARIAAADALLGEAVGTATRAWTDIAHVVGASHPAAMGAQLTRENAERARVITKQLLRALGRAL